MGTKLTENIGPIVRKSSLASGQKSSKQAEADENRTGSIIPVNCELSKVTVVAKLVEKIESSLSGIRLEDARVIISGGRGLGML